MANNIIHIYRPELTDAERARRMTEIKKAAERFIVAAERTKHEQHHQHDR